MINFNIIVAGSRSFNDYGLMKRQLDIYLSRVRNLYKVQIICGGALGADKLGKKYALENDIPVIMKKADWKKGKHAGMVRNDEMARIADASVIFWDGVSPGSKDMIKKSHNYGLKYRVIKYK